MFASVRAALEESCGVKVSVSQAQRLVRFSLEAGVVEIERFKEVVAPGSAEAEEVATSFRANRDRGPEVTELVAELLRRSAQ